MQIVSVFFQSNQDLALGATAGSCMKSLSGKGNVLGSIRLGWIGTLQFGAVIAACQKVLL